MNIETVFYILQAFTNTNMKTKLTWNLLFFFSLVTLFSCEKNIPDPVDPTTPLEQLLTAKVWKYNEYFTQYSQQSATVSYKIGKPSNQKNLSPNRVSFKTDKTYYEVTESGDTLRGTWRFLNNETQLEVKNPTGTYLSNIIAVNSANFIWFDTQRDIYARMIPADFSQLPSVTSSKLTSKKWMYVEYFTDFSRSTTGLAYKSDKPNNLIDLSKNRVTYNADGSVTEINEKGNSVPGTWQFITVGTDIGTQVKNYVGTFQSLLVNLDDSTMVWYDPTSNRYAKMKIAPNDDGAVVSARAKLLTNKTWLYTEYFSNYSAASAELTYKRDKASANPTNLSANRTTFNLDGTYTEITNTGATINGTWQFLENETKLKTVYSGGTFTSEIIQLDSLNFKWYDATRNTYGKMEVSPYVPNYTINASKLTGKTWIYYEYFSNYSTAQSALIYKRERTSNALNLTQNTTVFNANGTFNELNENGQNVTGTWQIINGNQIRTDNSLGGTHIATLIALDDQNYIWYNPTTNTYGKSIVKQ